MTSTDELYDAVRDIQKEHARGGITRDEMYNQISTLEKNWQEWLAVETNIAHLSQKVKDTVYSYAWEEGHASGYSDVYNHYLDFAAVALIASK